MTESQLNQWPADKIVRKNVSNLVFYARNSRTHSDEQVNQLAASIKEWGWTVPVLIDPDGGLIAGHGRILAAQRLGITEVPCVIAEGWTDAQKRAYVIADNKHALNATWDDDMLKVEISDLKEFDFDLSLTGFGEDEIAAMLTEPTEGLTDEDAVPDVPAQPVADEGDVWLLGRHRLMCGRSWTISTLITLMNMTRSTLTMGASKNGHIASTMCRSISQTSIIGRIYKPSSTSFPSEQPVTKQAGQSGFTSSQNASRLRLQLL